jgi:hypothetical protein
MGSICNHIGDTKVRKKAAEMVSLTKNLARLDSLVQPLGHSGTAPLAWPLAALISETKGGRNTKCEDRGRKRANQGLVAFRAELVRWCGASLCR